MGLRDDFYRIHSVLVGTGRTVVMIDGIKKQLELTDTPVLVVCAQLTEFFKNSVRARISKDKKVLDRVHFMSFKTFLRDACTGNYQGDSIPIKTLEGSYNRFNVFIDHSCYEYLIMRYLSFEKALDECLLEIKY